MPQEIAKALKKPIETSFALLKQFIDVCPDDIWAENNGGWPVWQQVYHALTAVDFFVMEPGASVGPRLAEGEIGSLQKIGDSPIPKDKLKNALDEAEKKVAQYVSKLTDADLAKKNEGLFGRAKMDMSHAATLSTLAGHTLYHLGSVDAALRDHGLKGVF